MNRELSESAATSKPNVCRNKNTIKEKNKSLTSIIILTFNNLAYNKRCISSIRRYTRRGTYELIVIDNNSKDGTLEWLKMQPDIKLISNNENVGFPAGCNQGIQIASGDFVMLLNNDTVVTKNWLNNLLTALRSSKKIGAVGPVTSYSSNDQQLPVPYLNLREMQAFAAEYNLSDESKWECVIKLIGYCILYKKEVLDKIGMLDERFSPGNFDDDDMSLRVIKAGYQMLLCHDTFIHHYGSTSFRQNMAEFGQYFQINHRKFIDKWGFDTSYAFEKRSDIVSLISNKENNPIKVLEVGCACGAMLLGIKNTFKNAEISGIESDKTGAEIAGTFANVKRYVYGEETITYPEGYFDYIVFSDVLQKLIDPWAELARFKKYLRENGHVIARIPNVLHYSVISGMLCGRWPYADSGILERTNLRFFTPTEVEIMFRSAGFNNIKFSGTVLPVTPEVSSVLDKLGKIVNAQVKPLLSIYKLIADATV